MQTEKLEAVSSFINKLTPKNLLLGAISGFIGLALYTLFESRSAAFMYLVSSPYLMMGVGVGFMLVVCGWIVSASLNRLEEFLQSKIDDQSKLIELLRAELVECQAECRNGTQQMLTSILEKLNA